jgi:hypothetical protein
MFQGMSVARSTVVNVAEWKGISELAGSRPSLPLLWYQAHRIKNSLFFEVILCYRLNPEHDLKTSRERSSVVHDRLRIVKNR